MTVTILRTGPLTVFKDQGRPGHADLGVAPSGASDRAAYARANALVGNPPGAAVLECTLGGLRVHCAEPVTMVLTGTDAVLTVNGTRKAVEEVVSVPPGAEVAVTMPRRGLRSCLAVRGGFAVPTVLGSRSTDRLAGIGPPRPAVGDTLPVGSPTVTAPTGSPTTAPATDADRPAANGPAANGPGADADGPLEVDLGPRDDWFTAAAIETLLSAEFTVSPAGDSVGLRLDGPVLTRSQSGELPSEGVVRGALQVPPDGHPIIFQADHPLTGGYPVIAVLTPAAADRAAQARPGARLRFAIALPQAVTTADPPAG